MCTVIAEFGIDTSELHNDSTSVSVSGVYRSATGTPRGGKPTPVVTFGHSKDHRPDLKQLVWILTVAADGAVPIAYRLADGNTTRQRPQPSAEQLEARVGRTAVLTHPRPPACHPRQPPIHSSYTAVRGGTRGSRRRVVQIDPEHRAAAGRITAQLAALGFVLPGTVLYRQARCGKPSCRCHADPPRLGRHVFDVAAAASGGATGPYHPVSATVPAAPGPRRPGSARRSIRATGTAWLSVGYCSESRS